MVGKKFRLRYKPPGETSYSCSEKILYEINGPRIYRSFSELVADNSDDVVGYNFPRLALFIEQKDLGFCGYLNDTLTWDGPDFLS